MKIFASRRQAEHYDLIGLSRDEFANLINALEVYKGAPHWSNSPWTRGIQKQLQSVIDIHDKFYSEDLSQNPGDAAPESEHG